jgi:hypothetical protein
LGFPFYYFLPFLVVFLAVLTAAFLAVVFLDLAGAAFFTVLVLLALLFFVVFVPDEKIFGNPKMHMMILLEFCIHYSRNSYYFSFLTI